MTKDYYYEGAQPAARQVPSDFFGKPFAVGSTVMRISNHLEKIPYGTLAKITETHGDFIVLVTPEGEVLKGDAIFWVVIPRV